MTSAAPVEASERGKKGGRGKKAAINGEVSGVPRQRLSDARAVLAYSREVATAPPGPNGTPMTGIPFEAATP